MPFDKMMDIVKHWVQNLEVFRMADKKVIEELQDITLDRKITDEIFGSLIRKAVLSNFGTSVKSPVNVTQVCRMIEQGAEVLTKEDFSNFTAWELMNNLTYVLKPNSSDMASLLNNQQAVSGFITDYFGIKYDHAIPLLN